MDKITYGSVEIDFDTLPASSQLALASRGVTHFLGNEQASKLAAWIKAEGQANTEDKAAAAAWKEANATAVSVKMDGLVAEAVAKLLAGTVGARAVGGVRVTPIEALKRQIAKREVTAILANNKLAFPKGARKDKEGNDVPAQVVQLGADSFTGDQLIERRLANPTEGPRIQKEAEKALRDAEKKNAALTDVATL